MNYQNLQHFLDIRTPKLVEWREGVLKYVRSYIDGCKNLPDEDKELNFNYSDNYQCWVSYAPYFFRELMHIYMELIKRGFTEEQLSPLIENKARVVRYIPQILLPGAFLDQTTDKATKMDFLDRFAKSAEAAIRSKGYEEPDSSFLWGMKPLPREQKLIVGNLIATLEEACDYVYFGDQTLGFTSFGIDEEIIPDYCVLYQDFDLNLGVKPVSPRGRIKTISVYPHVDVPYQLRMDIYNAHIFTHRSTGNQHWLPGRPPISHLHTASVIIDSTKASTDEIVKTTSELTQRFSDSKNRAVENKPNLHLEYCSMQSRVIKNLYGMQGKEWQLPNNAEQAIRDNSVIRRLKKDWGLGYNIEVSVELIKKAIKWCREST